MTRRLIFCVKKILFITLLISAVIGLAACGSKSANAGPGSGKAAGESVAPNGYAVKVTMNNAAVKSYSMEDLAKFAFESFEAEGKKQEGPSIAKILADAGITRYSKVTFKGMYKTSITLTSSQLDKGALLDVANRGTVKLAAAAIPKKDWVKDIAEIAVEE